MAACARSVDVEVCAREERVPPSGRCFTEKHARAHVDPYNGSTFSPIMESSVGFRANKFLLVYGKHARPTPCDSARIYQAGWSQYKGPAQGSAGQAPRRCRLRSNSHKALPNKMAAVLTYLGEKLGGFTQTHKMR